MNHVLAGADTMVEDRVVTLTGETLGVEMDGQRIVVKGFGNQNIAVLETIEADDCVIHKVDGVITPLWWDVQILELATSNTTGLQILTKVFRTLDQDLVATISSQLPAVTVFAPNDAAFAKLGEGVANFFFDRDSQDLLLPFFLNHALLGSIVAAADLKDEVRPTLAPEVVLPVTRSRDMEGEEVITLGNATLVMADLFANNGILHVIDQIILEGIELPTITTAGPAGTTDATKTSAPAATKTPVATPSMTPMAEVVEVTTAPATTVVDDTRAPVHDSSTDTAAPTVAATDVPAATPASPKDAEPTEPEMVPVSAAGPTIALGLAMAIAFVIL